MDPTARELFLASLKVDEIYPGKGNVFQIDASQTINEALNILVERNILSAPVVTREEGVRKCIGLIDVMDIAAFVLQKFEEGKHNVASKSFSEVLKDEKLSEIIDVLRDYHPVQHDASFKEIADKLVRYNVRRVPIVNEEGEIENFITQSEIVGILGAHLKELGKVIDCPVEKLKIGSSSIIKIHMDDRVVDAFTAMVKNNVSAVPVLDAADKLVATLSIKDIRVLFNNPFPLATFMKHIYEFLPITHADEVTARNPAVTFYEGATLGDVISKLLSNRIHRVWKVDKTYRVQGVISLGDVLSILVRDEESYIC